MWSDIFADARCRQHSSIQNYRLERDARWDARWDVMILLGVFNGFKVSSDFERLQKFELVKSDSGKRPLQKSTEKALSIEFSVTTARITDKCNNFVAK